MGWQTEQKLLKLSNKVLEILDKRVGASILPDFMEEMTPEEEWEREKEVINNEIVMGRDDPARVMQKLAARTAYNVHPYRVPVIGYEEVLKGMTRDDLMSFFKEHYVPNNMITVVVGDVKADEVLHRLSNTYKGWQRQSHSNPVLPVEPAGLRPPLVFRLSVSWPSRPPWQRRDNMRRRRLLHRILR